MKIQRMPEDIVPLLNDLVRRLTALETRPLGTVFVNETIIAKDPETGVETVIGDLKDYGEDRTGIKQWVNDTEPPAVPVMPIVTANLGVFSVVWTGFFEDDAPTAPDFSHLNVYGNNGTSTKLVGVIKTKDEVAIVTSDSEVMYDEVWSFWFTSVDQVGNESVPGPASANNQLTPLVESPDIQGAIDKVYEKIEKDFEESMLAANGKNRIWHTPEPPVEDPSAPFIDGDMWFDTNNGNKIHVWKDLPAPGTWEAAVLDSSALDDKVTDLIESAKNQADVALETANGKNKSYHQPSAPSGTNHQVGDIWFDTDDSNKVYVWNGTIWDPSSADWEIPQTVLDDILYAKNKSDQSYSLANGKNKRVDSVNNPPANTTGYIAGDHWLKWSNLGTTGVLLQSWTVKNGAWVLDSMDPTYLPKVDIGQGTFGSLNGDRLEVNTVKADKILVSATDNLIRDPNFNFPDTMWDNQTAEMGVGPEKWSTQTTYAGGARSMVLTQKPQGANQASYAALPSDYFEVVPGDSYAAFSMVYSDGGTDASMTYVSQRVYFYDKNKTILSGGPGNVDTGRINSSAWATQTWNKVGGVYVATAPENAAYMKPRLTIYRTANTAPGTRKYYVGSISVMRAMDSTLITPEAIQTPHIKAGAITAESGIIASLDAGKIVTGSMHGKFIEAGTLLASKLAVRNNDNLLPNLTYESDDWNLSSGVSIIDSSLSPEGKRLSFPPTALAQAIAYDVQVIPGEKYKVEANTYGTTASQNLEICWFGKDGKGGSAGSAVLIKSSTTNQKLSTEWEVPANVFSVRFSIRVPSTSPVNTATTGAYNFTVRKMTGTVLIENGAVTADQIKSGTITADSGVIASLDASKITVGELDGKVIKSGTVMSNSLVVGDFQNYATIDATREINVSNPSAWATESEGEWTKSKDGAGNYLFFMDRGGPIPFKTGEKFRVSFTGYSTVNQTSTMRGYFYNGPDGGSITYTPTIDVPMTTTATDYVYEVEVPNISSITGSGSWVFGFYNTTANNIRVKDVRILKMTDSTVITDDAILTRHIATDAIESRHIKANAIVADKIGAGAIRTSHLAVGTGRELVGNGSGQLGNNTGFEGFRYLDRNAASGTPVGHPAFYGSTAGQGTTNILTGDSALRVKPNSKYRVSVWVRASTSGSKIYLEPMTGSTASGERTTPTYPIEARVVPTTWTYWSEEFENGSAPSGTMYFRWFVNHSSGTNTGTIFYFTGFSVEELIEGTVIANDAITTGKIAANTITVDKLLIGPSENLIPDPNYETTSAGPIWYQASSGNSGDGITTSIVHPSQKISIRMDVYSQSASNVTLYAPYLMPNYRIPVTPGETYRVTSWAYLDATSVGNLTSIDQRVYHYTTRNGSIINGSSGGVTASNIPLKTWFEVGGTFTVPAGSYFLTPRLSMYYPNNTLPTPAGASWYISLPKVVRAAGGELIVDGAIDGKTITGALIQTDREPEVGVKLTNTGIVAYSGANTDSEDSSKTLSITGGRGVDYIGIWGNDEAIANEDGTISYPTGVQPEQVASIDYKGAVSGKTISAELGGTISGPLTFNGEALHDSAYGIESPGEFGPIINGRALVGANIQNHTDQHSGASDRTAWLDAMPLGLVARSYRNMAGISTENRETEILELAYRNVNSRAYKITVAPWSVYLTGTNAYGHFKIYRIVDDTSGGTSRPTMNDSNLLLAKTYRNETGSSIMLDFGGTYYDLSTEGGLVKYLFTFEASGGKATTYGSSSLGGSIRIWVEDMGLIASDTGSDRTRTRTNGGTTPTTKPADEPAPKPKPKETYTKTWSAKWWGNYHASSGSINSYFDSRGRVAQGNPPGSAGIQRGLVGFDKASIQSILSGATVKKVEVYVYAAHWYSSAGGTLVLGVINSTNKPTLISDITGTVDVKRQSMKKPEGRWITLPSTVYTGFKNGTNGIQTYINSSSLTYYGYLTGSKSKLRITYEK